MNAQITIDSRHPDADGLYEKCVEAWYASGFQNISSFDQVCMMKKETGETVEISYGVIRGYKPAAPAPITFGDTQ
ncbi:MAG: hypothetical protein ACJAZ1_002086 [Yoonia sp.]|jgi:hypothetical protein